MFSTEVKSTIDENFKGTDAEILSYTFADGVITLKCRADNNETPSKVVDNFVKQEAFSNITYTGYTNASDKETSKEKFNFDLSVQIMEYVPEVEQTAKEAE